MERFWLKAYPAGVPADVDVTQYRSLPALLEDAFRKYADRNAFIFMDHPLTYAELDRLSAAFGAWLRARGCHAGRAWRS
jgi:long-chain acyl-CoA synthetase